MIAPIPPNSFSGPAANGSLGSLGPVWALIRPSLAGASDFVSGCGAIKDRCLITGPLDHPSLHLPPRFLDEHGRHCDTDHDPNGDGMLGLLHRLWYCLFDSS